MRRQAATLESTRTAVSQLSTGIPTYQELTERERLPLAARGQSVCAQTDGRLFGGFSNDTPMPYVGAPASGSQT